MIPENEDFSDLQNNHISEETDKNSPNELPKFSKSKSKKGKKSESVKKFAFYYSDFGILSPEKFDYSSYPYLWCRYCGTRYAESFK